MVEAAGNSRSDVVTPPTGWGPDGKRAALALTFDNFGEASDLQLGTWDGTPIGSHFTVAWLPSLIELLGEVKATYFVEGSNAAIYPDPLHNWTAAGHEVGIHAWRHEIWRSASPRSGGSFLPTRSRRFGRLLSNRWASVPQAARCRARRGMSSQTRG